MARFGDIQQTLDARRQNGLQRTRRVLESAQGPEVQIDGSRRLAFCSNDYLGLANHPLVVEAFRDAALRYGVGAGASHLVNGHHLEHQLLEEELAEFTGRPRAVLFSTGYMANLGVITALSGRDDLVLEDKLNHASLIDAGQLSGAKFSRFHHASLESLQDRLLQAEGRSTLVVTDGVFSMDGDIAPLKGISELCRRQGAWLMVDDAHGFGTLGEQGGGCAEALGLTLEDVPVLVGTLGKAFGTSGAFVVGSDDLADMLVQFSRPYIYTTAMPPAVAAASRASLRLVREEGWRRQRLNQLIARFRHEMRGMGFELMPSDTAIQPVMVGDAAQSVALSSALEARGILITAIRPPTVPLNSSRLRVTLSAAHTDQHLDELLEAFSSVRHLKS